MYGTSHDDNEDLFQEILLQLWKSYPSFKGTAKISTWIYRVGLNTAITRLRRNTRKIHVQQLSFSHENLAESNSPRIDVEYDKELQRAINVLNRFDKALVMLYLDEKSYREMAEILGLSESNIGVKINRVKKKLKELVNP